MKMNSIMTASFAIAVGLSACNQNPYDAFNGKIVEVKESPTHVRASPNTLEVPAITECYEGKTCAITIVPHVPPPGKASVVFGAPLPKNAVYNAAKNQIIYKPEFDAVDLASNPDGRKSFLINAAIYDSNQPKQVGYQDFNIIAVNVVRDTKITFVSGKNDVTEGQAFDQIIRVENPDFVGSSDFQLLLSGGPDGVQPSPIANRPGYFSIHFVPSPNFVTVADPVVGIHFQKSFKVTYTGFPPQGAKATQTATWTVTDKRLPPMVIAPDAISQGATASFSISAHDLNGEVSPIIVVGKIPTVGGAPLGVIKVTDLVQSTSTGAAAPYSKQVSVVWDQIDFTKPFDWSKPIPIGFQVCVLTKPNFYGACVSKEVSVRITPVLMPTPTPNPSVSPTPTATPANE